MSSLVDGLLDRSIVFSFDRTGYRRHSTRFDPADLDVDLAGRVCLVTGASAGLGRVVSQRLAARGGEVWMLVRDGARGEAAAAEIRNATGTRAVDVAVVDVSSLASVRAFVDAFPPRRVDVLVNNAGVLPPAYEETPDGLEVTLATNLVGPFLLTTLLVPRLARSDDARVVTVSSGGMYTQRLVVSGLTPDPGAPFDGAAAYARTKRAQVVLTELWAERYRHAPITWSSMHPGWADTPGVRGSLPRFWRLTRRILRTPEEGADTIVWLAVCRRVKGVSGRFWFDREAVRTHLLSSTIEAPGERAELWRSLHRWSRLRVQSLAS
jgi:NAD(P)-dependent dehydrogenase (short-subunit alcohol dehydrogenase family)